jgi:hypothetical protein
MATTRRRPEDIFNRIAQFAEMAKTLGFEAGTFEVSWVHEDTYDHLKVAFHRSAEAAAWAQSLGHSPSFYSVDKGDFHTYSWDADGITWTVYANPRDYPEGECPVRPTE